MGDIEAELRMLYSRPLFDIELSRLCNARCCFCPRNKLYPVDHPVMDKRTILKTIDWIPHGSSSILAGLGEPLLNDNIYDLISGLRKKHVNVSLITNGILLSEDIIKMLYDAGLNEIQISLHTLDPDKHKEVTGTDKYPTVLDNIKRIGVGHYKEMGIRLVSAIDLKGDQRKEFIDFAEKNGFVPSINKTHSRGGLNKDVNVEKTGCGVFPSVTFIDYTGTIRWCSNDPLGESLGTIFKDSFEQIQSKKEGIIRNEWVEPACHHCDDTNRWESLERGDIHKVVRAEKS